MVGSTRAIFLSYASQDAEAARRICEGLRAAGLEVWFDQSELRGGEAWDASIRRKIRECALFVPVISATTNARGEGYFRLEWKLAVDRSHLMAEDQPFLAPVVIDGSQESSARVPDRFRERQWPRLTDERAIAAFAAHVSAILFGEKPPAAAPAVPLATAGKSSGAGDSPSIAVLAFANRSSDPNDEYFSDGLADELLNVLARIRGLRVAARTSSFQFKGKAEDMAVIGRKLNVATVLEGSVRKSGNRVRISVQLVKVAEAARGRSDNPEAYRLYLQGRYLIDRLTAADITRGIECLRAAIALDPDFALAHAAQSRAHAYEGGWGLRAPQDATALARAAALRSLALEPDLVEGLLALGTLQMWHDWDWTGARASLGRAKELAPGKPEVLRDYGLLMYLLVRFDEAVVHGRQAIERDPLNATSHLYLSFSLLGLEQPREAEAACRKALELSPDGIAFRYWLAIVLDAQGRCEEGVAEALLDKSDWSRLASLACLYHRMGRDAESAALLAELKDACADLAAFQIAQVHAVRGEPDDAFAWLERAFDQRDAGVSMIKVCPWFDTVHGDPRWERFLRKVGFSPTTAARA